jgi:hypothetical protein
LYAITDPSTQFESSLFVIWLKIVFKVWKNTKLFYNQLCLIDDLFVGTKVLANTALHRMQTIFPVIQSFLPRFRGRALLLIMVVLMGVPRLAREDILAIYADELARHRVDHI